MSRTARASASPVPDAEEAAAIAAAIELLWPKPAAPVSDDGLGSSWRFSGRWWTEPNGWPRRDY